MPGEFTALDLLFAFILGAIIVYGYWATTRKKWFLESMSPRNHYELGRERKLLVNMKIHNKAFNGVKAGKYTLFLTHGSLSDFSKAIFHGKIEHIYSTVLAERLIAKNLVRKIEKSRFLSFIFQRLPELAVRGYLITGELVSHEHILELWEDETDKSKAWEEMKGRKLVSPQILWVKPYPPEGQLREIMSGIVMLPDLIEQHEEDIAGITGSYRETLVQVNRGMASMLTKFIPLARHIVTSISDPTFVMALIISDRAQQIRGLGISQLAEKGGIEGQIEALRQLIKHRDEFVKLLGPTITEKEMRLIETLQKDVNAIKEFLKTLEKPALIAKPPAG